MDLKTDLFDHFRCDRPMTMGINIVNLCKILKCAGMTPQRAWHAARSPGVLRTPCRGEHLKWEAPSSATTVAPYHTFCLHPAGNEDTITLKAEDDGDKLTLMFEAKKQDKVRPRIDPRHCAHRRPETLEDRTLRTQNV